MVIRKDRDDSPLEGCFCFGAKSKLCIPRLSTLIDGLLVFLPRYLPRRLVLVWAPVGTLGHSLHVVRCAEMFAWIANVKGANWLALSDLVFFFFPFHPNVESRGIHAAWSREGAVLGRRPPLLRYLL